jgi:hypothetical protein
MKSKSAKYARVLVLYVPFLLANLVWRGISGAIEFVTDTADYWRRIKEGIA